MSEIRLYIDEDAMSLGLVVGLRARGVDVQTVVDAGLGQCDDHRQIKYACESGRVLYSFNTRDFCRIHTETLQSCHHHAGIIVFPRQRYDIGEPLRRLSILVNETSAEEMVDRLTFL